MKDKTVTTDVPNLYALVIRLIAGDDGRLRATQGELAHAAFLDILQQVDADLSQTLHDLNGRKPFTISPLHGYRRRGKGQLAVRAGESGWLRVTLLDPALFHTFITYFLQGPRGAAVRLGKIPFQVSEILSTTESHFLAGADSLQALREKWTPAGPGRDRRAIALTFGSPTAFSIRNPNTPFRLKYVLPDPGRVFGELARYWDEMAGDDLMDGVSAYAKEAVAVSRHNIRTRMYRYRRSKQIGFTGNVHYAILDSENDEMIRHLNRLADLAFYTGLGSKTTMGMGQVYRMIEDDG